jgi:hypothetical protein
VPGEIHDGDPPRDLPRDSVEAERDQPDREERKIQALQATLKRATEAERRGGAAILRRIADVVRGTPPRE